MKSIDGLLFFFIASLFFFFVILSLVWGTAYVIKSLYRKAKGEPLGIACITGEHNFIQISTKRQQCIQCNDTYSIDSFLS